MIPLHQIPHEKRAHKIIYSGRHTIWVLDDHDHLDEWSPNWHTSCAAAIMDGMQADIYECECPNNCSTLHYYLSLHESDIFLTIDEGSEDEENWATCQLCRDMDCPQ